MNIFKKNYIIKLICLYVLFLSFKFTKQYYIFFKCCLKYFQYYHYLDKNCLKCQKEIIFDGLNTFSSEETLNEILEKNRSISRFGDGELRLIFGERIGFQANNKTLALKLKRVLKSKEKGLLIGINIPYNDRLLNIYNNFAQNYYIKFFERHRLNLFTLNLFRYNNYVFLKMVFFLITVKITNNQIKSSLFCELKSAIKIIDYLNFCNNIFFKLKIKKSKIWITLY